MWKVYMTILLIIPVSFFMCVGLKMLFGWWTGDWKSAICQAVGFGLLILGAFEYHRRTSKRKANISNTLRQ